MKLIVVQTDDLLRIASGFYTLSFMSANHLKNNQRSLKKEVNDVLGKGVNISLVNCLFVNITLANWLFVNITLVLLEYAN